MIRVVRFAFSSLDNTLKNLSNTQLVQFKQLITNEDDKQLKLVAYLVQHLKPSLNSYTQILVNQIRQNAISCNQDLEFALKLIQKSTHPDQYLTQFQLTIDEQKLSAKIKQVVHQFPTLNSQDQLIKVQEAFPDCTLEKIQSMTKDKQTEGQKQIYQKIQTFTPRDIPEQHNQPEKLLQHKKEIEGKIILRFPPEPNGYLHLGHVRSIRLNFHSAEQLNGTCYLRYDDTNPANEKQTFIDEIAENVRWFGHQPTHITYASDYFQFLFDSAIKLIKEGKAFVCEQTRDQIKEYRKNKQPSPFRNRCTEDNLRLFSEMQEGKHPEAKYTLRLKIDCEHPNPTLRDPVIYRVLYQPHPRSGQKWKVYPMYDFAHCICDSLENITHSLCTLEFEIRRELYYWILTNLNLYKPFVYEFSRLNVSNNMLSKRKIAKLIEMGIVSGWDDPRLLTLAGLRRRGYTAQAINEFIDQVSVPRGGNEHIVSIKLLENCIRKELEKSAIKLIAVINPVRMEVLLDDHTVKSIYIQENDIRLQDQPDFYGVAPKKLVCLRFYGVVYCESIIAIDGKITLVKSKLMSTDINDRKKIKGQINWLEEHNCINATANEYSYLFDSENPGQVTEFWQDINKNSLIVHQIKIPSQITYNMGERFQFERNGFYIVDSIVNGHLYFNKIVGLVDREKRKIESK